MGRLERAKCDQSPTGAHWWMIPTLGAHPLGKCKFCGNERPFKGSYGYEWIDFDESHRRTVAQALKDAKISGV